MEIKKKWILILFFIIGLFLFFKITKNYRNEHMYKPIYHSPIYIHPNNNQKKLPLNMPPKFEQHNMNSHFVSYPNIHWIRHNK